jgi:hypothetical protein
MACGKCGNARCTCPPKKEKPNTNFIVTDDFKVVTVAEFDADPANNTVKVSYLGGAVIGRSPLNPVARRFNKPEFKKRVDAEAHARDLCEQAVEETRAELQRLKNILKVQRPWEKT